MTEFSDFYLGKKKDNMRVNLANIKGGIKSEALQKEVFSIFKDALDTNSDKIVDKEEIDKFIEEIKSFAKDNNFSMKEAAQYLKAKNLKEIKQEELFKLIQNLAQASENIAESTVITGSNGEKTIFIKYKDNTEETIYPDKSSKFETIGQDNEKITINKNTEGETTSEITIYSDNSKRTVIYENNEPIQEISEKEGTVTTINYEEGKPKTKEVKSGEEIEKFEYINGKELAVYSKKYPKVSDEKQWIETTNDYDESGRILQTKTTTENQNANFHYITTEQENFEYRPNNQLAKHTYLKTENKEDSNDYRVITNEEKTVTYDENGNRIKLTTNSHTKYKEWEAGWDEFESSETIEFDKDGNIVGYVPKGETLQSILKQLKITPETDLYNKFIDLNKDQIKSYNNGKVKGFDVGAKIIIPGELEEKAYSYYTTNPNEEKDSYTRENIGNADIQGIPSEYKTLEKDSTWWEIARQNLIDLGIKKPTQAQIAENFDLLITLNQAWWEINSIVEKGRNILVRTKESNNIPDKLKLESYNIKTLRQNYPSSKYEIKKTRVNPKFNEWGEEATGIYAYHIYDKSSGKKILEVSPSEEKFSNELIVKYFKPDGKVSSELKFGSYDKSIQEILYNSDKTVTNNYSKQGTLTSQEYTDPKTGYNYKISNPNSPNKEVRINGEDYYEHQKYQKGKIYQRITQGKVEYYNSNGEFAYSVQKQDKELKINYPEAKNLAAKLKSKDFAGVLDIVNTLDKTNYKAFLSAYETSNNKDLIKAIENSKLDENQKTQILGKIRKIINEDNKITKTQRSSQVSNPNYKGAAYDIKLSGDTLAIKNKTTGKISKINLKEFLSKCTEFEQAVLKKQLVEELPGEVLEDLAIESKDVRVSKDMKTESNNPDFEAAGYYRAYGNTITLSRKEIYNIKMLNILLERERESSIPEIYIHELGHAIDFNGYLLNTNSSDTDAFKKVFEKELQNYIAAGKVQYSYEKGFEVKEETIETGDDLIFDTNTVYATANVKEMFAECYTLMMHGDCQSKKHILKYFPQTFKAAKNLLKEIRQKSENERHGALEF